MSTYTPPRYISARNQAKMIRAALKTAFPGVKFSVRCSRGSAINVRWTDGPTVDDVRAITQLYRGGGFDGMQDLRYSVQTVLSTDDGAELVQFSADFVFEQREISPAARAQIVRELDPLFALSHDVADEAVWREVCQTRVPVHVDREGVAYRMGDGTSECLSDVVHRIAWHRSETA